MTRRWFSILTALLLAAGLLAGLAEAQQRFELADGDWQLQEAPDPASPEGILQEIRTLIAAEHGKQAEKMATQWIEAYPNHHMLAEAYLLLGDARVVRKHYYHALFPYEQVIRRFPATEQYDIALRREYDIAVLFTRRPNRVWRIFWGMRIIPADEEGVEIFIRLQERVPGSQLGELASLTLADYYFGEADMYMAAEAYDVFLLNYPNSQYREYAMLRLIEASLARFRGPQFDATGLIEAMERLELYRREFPAGAEQIDVDAYLIRINESMAQKDFLAARWYERRGEYVSADFLYRRLIDAYPTSASAYQAIGRIEGLEARSRDRLITPELEAAMRDSHLREQDREALAVPSLGVEEQMIQEEGVIDPGFDALEADDAARARDAAQLREAEGIGSAIEQDMINADEIGRQAEPTGTETEIGPY